MKNDSISINKNASQLAKDGFYLSNQDHGPKSLAAVSLKVALKAYFSTYQSMDFFLQNFTSSTITAKDVGFFHTKNYCEQCCEAIIHFHHFFELTCKEILRNENPLLAEDASKKPEILYKLLKGETISSEDHEKLKSIEFDTALDRLCDLIKNQNFGSGSLDFLNSSKQTLKELNRLRNRLLHRGIYILNYPAFDIFIGKYILPLVVQILSLPHFKGISDWKYNSLDCKIDPINEIINEFAKDSYNICKVAYLKELGRSAYINDISKSDSDFNKFFNQQKCKQIEKMASSQIGDSNINDVTVCPVCGLATLIVYDDIEYDDYDDATRSFSKAFRYTWQARCINCTFEISNFSLNNASDYGLNLPDYWKSENL